MVRDVDLGSYLPPFMQHYEELMAVLEAQNPEFVLVWEAVERIFCNRFISTADEYGISRLERILEIFPSNKDTLELRRERVLFRSNEQLPFTMKSLKSYLEAIFGDNIVIDLDADKYILTVRSGMSIKNAAADIAAMLMRVCPENIVIDIQILNTHQCLNDFTHSNMSGFTHEQLRNEELEVKRSFFRLTLETK